MTELTKWDDGRTAVARMANGATRLVEWAQEADAAYALAQKLTATAFCPEQFRGKPADAAAAMLAGGELGLSPLAALGAFDVIQGRAAARAITLRALVQSKGHELVLVESTESRCTMRGRRAGSAEWQTVRWTIDRAKSLNLTGKSNWKQQPGAMLVARATSELARLIASDAILGIGGGYSAEEYADGGPVVMAADVAAPEPTSAGTRVMSRKRRATPEPQAEAEPERVEEPAEAEIVEDTPAEDGITQPQLRKMGALMREAGLTDRAGALAFVAETIGRDVESRNDLTKREAGQVIDALEPLVAATPAPDPADDPVLWEQTAAAVDARDEGATA